MDSSSHTTFSPRLGGEKSYRRVRSRRKRRKVRAAKMKHVKFVVGIDDRVYMRWQLSILLESLHGKLPPGWEVWVVVCNGHQELSADLKRVLDTYGARTFTGVNHPRDQNMDFASGSDVYVPLNRIEALRVVGEHLGSADLVCLIETDVFLYGDLNPS